MHLNGKHLKIKVVMTCNFIQFKFKLHHMIDYNHIMLLAGMLLAHGAIVAEDMRDIL